MGMLSHSSRIALGYLGLSVLWIGVSDSLFAVLFPETYPAISLYKGWGFVAVTAFLLKFWLAAEEKRRDEIETQLQESAVTDALTGMRNRAAFIEHLDQAVLRARREGRRFGLLFVDLDNFKRINDTLGHAVGDDLLREVAGRIEATVRDSDVAARLGGDEFIVLVDDCPNIQALADRLLAALREPFAIGGHALDATASIGAALYPEHGVDGIDLMRSADLAMYRAKAEGRDRLTLAAGETPTRISLHNETPAGNGGRLMRESGSSDQR
jgi:diguanylate cyclase (GGDEF)-like protein